MEANRYDAYREDTAGRANVADSPERIAYYQDLARLETGALWTVANKIEPWAPRSASCFADCSPPASYSSAWPPIASISMPERESLRPNAV